MSVNAKDSLICLCNGICKCGLHNTIIPFPIINNPKQLLDAIKKQYNEEPVYVKLVLITRSIKN